MIKIFHIFNFQNFRNLNATQSSQTVHEHLTSTVVTSRFHVQHQGPEASLQDFYISSRFHEEDVVRGVYWHGYPIYDRLAPIQYKT